MKYQDERLFLSPTDLNNFLACEHRTALDLREAQGGISKDAPPRPDADLIAERGRQHEQEYLERLAEEGNEIASVDRKDGLKASVEATSAAMGAGVDVIHQAAFADGEWSGYADFLLKVGAPSDLGSWAYEAADAKLATHPRPHFVLQLLFYSEQVARLQGRVPDWMHLVLGTQERHSFRPSDFSSYGRRVRERFLHYLDGLGDGAQPPYPYPVEHCRYCDWWARCRDKRHDDDHLSLVAFLDRRQAMKLEDDDIRTVYELGVLPPDRRVRRLSAQTLAGLRQQARLQLTTREAGEHVRELLEPQPGRGFARLPDPALGDVFFDIEGDPYWGREGLEYLLGTMTLDGVDGVGEYTAIWSHDRADERVAFERWVDWMTARLGEHPDMHIYHYAPYEPTAIKKLMSRHGTREAEVDELLRRKVFVDLYAIVRQSMRIGEDSYSLKSIEAFYPLDRDAAVTEAGGSILAYQAYVESGDPDKLDAIAEYNRDDCRSTAGLRDWLLDQRADAEREFGIEIASLEQAPARELTEEKLARVAEIGRLGDQLTTGIPEEEDAIDDEQRARRLLADLLEYHRREARPAWWEYFDRLTKTPEELCEEDAEAIGSLKLADDVQRREEKQSYIYPLRFPEQQHKLGPGKAVNPTTERSVPVVEVDDANGIAWVKRGKKADHLPLPRSLIPDRPILQEAQKSAIRVLAARVCENGLDPAGELDAACDLLMRRPPGLRAGAALQRGSFELERLKDEVARLDRSALLVQGPPGSGKTWAGARVIVKLLARELRVGVMATSHKAIHNLLDEIEDAAAEAGVDFVGLKKASGDNPESDYDSDHITSSTKADDFPPPDEIGLIAGTAWLWPRSEMREAVDILFVDEAGQVAVADAVAAAQGTGSVVLLGDPQQLAHVSQGTHPRGSGASVLEHLLGDAATVEAGMGVFLDRTYRMHPDVCRFVSDAMYDGRLESASGCESQQVASRGLSGAGLRVIGVEHVANRQTAPEEAECIAREVEVLLDGGEVTEAGGAVRALDLEDILVVAPYNAQVRRLRAKLPDGARVGTVDKFQGQEAPVVFFSMTSSSGEDVPRGMDFLFSRNRLNVAVSRAQAMAVIVCSPSLLSARCSTVEQMRLVNALCQFADEAERQARA